MCGESDGASKFELTQTTNKQRNVSCANISISKYRHEGTLTKTGQ